MTLPTDSPLRLLVRLLPQRLRPGLDVNWPTFHDGLEVIRRPKMLAGLLLINLFGWGGDILITWAYGSAFNLNLPLSAYVSITVALSVVTTFPITFGNIGFWELGVLSILALYDVPADQAIAYAVGTHIFIMLFDVGIGLLAIWSGFQRWMIARTSRGVVAACSFSSTGVAG